MNLTDISGIGPARVSKLEAVGIATVQDVAALSEAKASELDAALGFNGAIAREKWVEQAVALLANGTGTETGNGNGTGTETSDASATGSRNARTSNTVPPADPDPQPEPKRRQLDRSRPFNDISGIVEGFDAVKHEQGGVFFQANGEEARRSAS